MPDLTPTEMARVTGIPRNRIIALCMELGVPIFGGRINRQIFEGAIHSGVAAHYALFDSSGNLIDSYETAGQAYAALDQIESREGRGHAAVVAYDADGNVIGAAGGPAR